MADRTKTGKGPCDKCGSDDDCRCGPCQCKWCRYRRGDASKFERAQVEADMERYRQADIVASAARMQRNIDSGGTA